MIKKALRYRYDWSAFVYIAPICIVILVMSVIPIITAFYYSFTHFDGVRTPTFIGLRNYVSLFSDQILRTSIVNTLIYTLITVPLQSVLALFFAYWLSTFRQGRWAQFIRGTLFVPVIASSMVAGIIWRAFMGSEGPLNIVLGWIGIGPVSFMGIELALISTGLVAVWRNVGYFMVIYFAAIMEIPKTLYESAELEGCNFWQKFFYITIPMLRSTTFLIVILGTIWSFQVFDLVFAFTRGGPGFATTTMVMTIYNTSFRQFNLGYASAQAFVLLLFIVAASVIQKIVLNRSGDSTIG